MKKKGQCGEEVVLANLDTEMTSYNDLSWELLSETLLQSVLGTWHTNTQ